MDLRLTISAAHARRCAGLAAANSSKSLLLGHVSNLMLRELSI